MIDFLRSDPFRERVEDDITLLVMGNIRTLSGQMPPPFDMEKWDRTIRTKDS